VFRQVEENTLSLDIEDSDLADAASILSEEPSVNFDVDDILLNSPLYRRVYGSRYLKRTQRYEKDIIVSPRNSLRPPEGGQAEARQVSGHRRNRSKSSNATPPAFPGPSPDLPFLGVPFRGEQLETDSSSTDSAVTASAEHRGQHITTDAETATLTSRDKVARWVNESPTSEIPDGTPRLSIEQKATVSQYNNLHESLLSSASEIDTGPRDGPTSELLPTESDIVPEPVNTKPQYIEDGVPSKVEGNTSAQAQIPPSQVVKGASLAISDAAAKPERSSIADEVQGQARSPSPASEISGLYSVSDDGKTSIEKSEMKRDDSGNMASDMQDDSKAAPLNVSTAAPYGFDEEEKMQLLVPVPPKPTETAIQVYGRDDRNYGGASMLQSPTTTIVEQGQDFEVVPTRENEPSLSANSLNIDFGGDLALNIAATLGQGNIPSTLKTRPIQNDQLSTSDATSPARAMPSPPLESHGAEIEQREPDGGDASSSISGSPTQRTASSEWKPTEVSTMLSRNVGAPPVPPKDDAPQSTPLSTQPTSPRLSHSPHSSMSTPILTSPIRQTTSMSGPLSQRDSPASTEISPPLPVREPPPVPTIATSEDRSPKASPLLPSRPPIPTISPPPVPTMPPPSVPLPPSPQTMSTSPSNVRTLPSILTIGTPKKSLDITTSSSSQAQQQSDNESTIDSIMATGSNDSASTVDAASMFSTSTSPITHRSSSDWRSAGGESHLTQLTSTLSVPTTFDTMAIEENDSRQRERLKLSASLAKQGNSNGDSSPSEGSGKKVPRLRSFARLSVRFGADKTARLRTIHEAAQLGNTALLESALQDSSVRDVQSSVTLGDESKPKTALMRAAAGGHVDCMERLVKAGADFATTDKQGRIALHYAVMSNQLKATQWMAERFRLVTTSPGYSLPPGPLEIVNGGGYGSLAIAAALGHVDIVQILITSGADLEGADRMNRTPILTAIAHAQVDTVRALITAGANVNHEAGASKETPLMCAARAGLQDVVELLLEAKADRTAKDINGEVAVHHASRHGHLDAVEALYMSLEDLEVKNNIGERPLHLACAGNQPHVVKALLRIGCSANSWTEPPTKKKNTKVLAAAPLHYACRGGHYDCAEALIEHGALVNSNLEDGTSPLHMACEANDLATVCLLRQSGANMNASRAVDLITPLHIAAKGKDSLDIVKELLDYGANPRLRNKKDETPAIHAINGKVYNPDVVKYLSQHNHWIAQQERRQQASTRLGPQAVPSTPSHQFWQPGMRQQETTYSHHYPVLDAGRADPALSGYFHPQPETTPSDAPPAYHTLPPRQPQSGRNGT
jgi:ankyrin repeat protein